MECRRAWAGSVVGRSLLRRTGRSENPWKPTTQMVKNTDNSESRAIPCILQMVLVCAGMAVLLDNLWILILTPVCAWLLQTLAIRPEERYLERKFGESLCRVQEPGSSLACDLSVRTIRSLCGMVCRNAGCARYSFFGAVG